MWLGVCLAQSDYRILWSTISLERTNQHLWFFYMEIVTKGRHHLRLPLLVGCGQLCLWSSQIPGFFDHQYLWKESIETFNWPFSFYISFLIVFLHPINLTGPFSLDWLSMTSKADFPLFQISSCYQHQAFDI